MEKGKLNLNDGEGPDGSASMFSVLSGFSDQDLKETEGEADIPNIGDADEGREAAEGAAGGGQVETATESHEAKTADDFTIPDAEPREGGIETADTKGLSDAGGYDSGGAGAEVPSAS